jgi:hypothetical protein
MPYPLRFKPLLELELNDVPRPDYAWLVYAVCGCDDGACGWHGWVIDSVFQRSATRHPTGTGDALLSSSFDRCPDCGRSLFRTAASMRFEPSALQEPVHGRAGIDYEVAPMEYEP